jgi:hypothetical protein
MKYIITENKLNNIIDEFISSQFDSLKHINDNKTFEFRGRRDVWVGDDGLPVIIILNIHSKSCEVLILDNVYDLIYNMFSIKGYPEIQKYLVNWFEKHMGIKVDEVNTFDNGEYVY